MSKNLALTLIGPRAPTNTATHGDTIRIEFTDPPNEADDVVITIRDFPRADKGGRYVDVLTIEGRIRGGKFECHSYAPVIRTDHTKHEMRVGLLAPDQEQPAPTQLPDYAPRESVTLLHRLAWRTEGRVGGSRESMTGNATFDVAYKCAMIVPTGNAPAVAVGQRDPSLPLLSKWATQWQKPWPSLRKKVEIKTVSLHPIPPDFKYYKLKPDAYAPLLAAFETAAEFAKRGIIALAVGHGDQGKNGVPWLDITAEDGVELDANRHVSGVFHGLLVNDLELKEMKEEKGENGVTVMPGSNTVIKRDALNAIRAILAKREVRLLLLHTCTLGANEDFVQLLSDRLQVRIRAHKAHVTYTGSTPITVSYEDDPPLPNEGDHEWPTSQLGFEVQPGAVPSK